MYAYRNMNTETEKHVAHMAPYIAKPDTEGKE